MKHDPIKTTVLSVKIIRTPTRCLKSLGAKGERSLGISTTYYDDVSYAASTKDKKAR